jgi:membrane carboxypeptidase/penicillin-binding protein PbpC
MAVYTHCMYSLDARGISAVSRAVYGKAPSELTTAEAIGLVAIFRQPSASPTRNPQRFRENVQRLTERYRGAV